MEGNCYLQIFLLDVQYQRKVWIVIILYRRSTALKRRGPRVRGDLNLSMPIRILAYGFYIAIALRQDTNDPQRPHLTFH
jgi:hypothetical protein